MPAPRSLLAVIFTAAVASAADWPQWLGPDRDGSSPEKVAAWKDAPKVLWRQPAGEGNCTPVVADGRVFLHAKVADKDEEVVTAFDAKTGKELWRTAYPRGNAQFLYGNGPRGTPAVVDGKVHTFGVTGILSCFDAANGKQLWQVDTLKAFNAKNLFFGAACSPLVEDGKVLINVGGKGASVVAFAKDSGEVAWKTLDDGASYSSPIVIGTGKEKQVIFLTGAGVVSLNPADGSLYWKFPLVDKLFESSSTPIRAGDVLIASSITYGSAGLNLVNSDGKPGYKEAWKNGELTCYFATPMPVGKDHVYLVTGSNPLAIKKPQATLRCIETKTGKELWNRPGVGTYHASLLRTGDDKLLLLEDDGELVLVDPSPKEYRELARSKVCGQTWAHTALVDGRLYIRDNKEVICLELPK